MSMPRKIFFIDNTLSDDESFSDVDEDFSVVEDNILYDIVTYATGSTSTQAQVRQRMSVHVAEPCGSKAPALPTVVQRAPTV